MKCHLTIGPSVPYNIVHESGRVECGFDIPDPRDCIGSECSAWCQNWQTPVPRKGWCGLVDPAGECVPTWPDPAAKESP
jgi:hypothetical protein